MRLRTLSFSKGVHTFTLSVSHSLWRQSHSHSQDHAHKRRKSHFGTGFTLICPVDSLYEVCFASLRMLYRCLVIIYCKNSYSGHFPREKYILLHFWNSEAIFSQDLWLLPRPLSCTHTTSSSWHPTLMTLLFSIPSRTAHSQSSGIWCVGYFYGASTACLDVLLQMFTLLYIQNNPAKFVGTDWVDLSFQGLEGVSES